MADEEESEPKGFDISKLTSKDNDAPRATDRLAKHVAELQSGTKAMQAVLRSVSGLSAAEQAAKALAPYNRIQDQLDSMFGRVRIAQIARQQDLMRSLLPDVRSHLSTMSGVSDLLAQRDTIREAISSVSALPGNWADIYGLSAAARLAEEMRERHALYLQPTSMFADFHRDHISDIRQSIRALALPQFDALEAVRMDRIKCALSCADVFKSLDMPSLFDKDLRSVTSLLNDRLSTVTNAVVMAEAARSALFAEDAFSVIEGLLARSLEAQEALLAEHRESESDAKKEARFHRRMVTLASVINILMFLITVAMQIEDLVSDDDSAVHENTRAIHEMRESFDEMATQMERMQSSQDAANEAEQATDAAIVDILRDIANTLEAQSTPAADKDTDDR